MLLLDIYNIAADRAMIAAGAPERARAIPRGYTWALSGVVRNYFHFQNCTTRLLTQLLRVMVKRLSCCLLFAVRTLDA
jgi:hypothetical protein